MDVQEFLNPISDLNPVGDDSRWEPEYEQLEDARRADDDTSADPVWRREFKRADWGRVVDLGTKILQQKSKDLQVVAYMTEAWAHLRGIAGISDGLDLMRAVQGAFWDGAHPEKGNPEMRRGVYEFLDDPRVLPARIRSTALTQVEGSPQLSYSFVKYREAIETDKNYLKETDEKRALLEGNLRGADFDNAAKHSPRTFYVELLESLRACRTVAEELNRDLSQRWPATPKERPPQLSEFLTAIDDVEREARRLLARKPAPDVAAVAKPEDAAQLIQETEPESAPDESSPKEPTTGTMTSPRSSEPNQTRTALTTADEAVTRIVDAAHFLRRADPADPASYLVLRALQAAGLYRGDDALASGDLPPPATEDRQRLYQLSRTADDGQWAELLEESERALGRPEGRGWLDPQCYAARALETLGYHNAARACTSVLATWLQDHEQWPESQLRDGTPCASSATRDWIEREFHPAAQSAGLASAIPPTGLAAAASSGAGTSSTAESVDGTAGQPDPWEQAQALCRSGRRNEAMSVMVHAVRQARAGREGFFRRLQQAELCLSFDRPDLALPLFEFLAQRIDDLRLDQWEDGSLCARVFSHLYRCLQGRDEARATAVYNRLCQIDAGEALLLGEIGSSGVTDVNLKNGLNFKKRSNPSLGKTDIMSS